MIQSQSDQHVRTIFRQPDCLASSLPLPLIFLLFILSLPFYGLQNTVGIQLRFLFAK